MIEARGLKGRMDATRVVSGLPSFWPEQFNRFRRCMVRIMDVRRNENVDDR